MLPKTNKRVTQNFESPSLYFVSSCLEQISGVDVECSVAVLFAVFAYRLAVLKADNEVLVHDESEACTNGYVKLV